MDAIRQVTLLLEESKVAKIDIIDNQDTTNRYTEFYQLLKNSTIKTDLDAVRHFYQIDDVQDQRYRKFKLRFKEKIGNLVFFVDTNDDKVGDYQNTYTNAQKTWAFVNILYTRSALVAAMEYSEQLIKICLQYEFTELIVQITDRLKYCYSVALGDKAKYTYYRDLHFKHLEYLNAEFLAKDAFQRIKIEYVKTVAFKREMLDEATKAVEELTPLVSKCDTFTFMAFWYYVRLSASQVIYDHKSNLATCEEGLKFLGEKKFDTRKAATLLMNQKLISQIQLHRYEDGKKTAIEVLALQIEGTHNWYKTLEQHMMLAFHTREYRQAYDVYLTATKHKGYAFLTGRNKEIWVLFSAYLYFLIKVQRVEGILLEQSGLKEFRTARFLNELQQISADKKGMNIPTLIINFILQLSSDGKSAKKDLSDGVEAMQKYIVRHVKKTDASFRSNIFMKLLTHIFEQGGSKKLIAPVAKKLMNEISESHPDIMEQGDRIEILPFEYLWEDMQPLLRA
jgi:hypothetical protein